MENKENDTSYPMYISVNGYDIPTDLGLHNKYAELSDEISKMHLRHTAAEGLIVLLFGLILLINSLAQQWQSG